MKKLRHCRPTCIAEPTDLEYFPFRQSLISNSSFDFENVSKVKTHLFQPAFYNL